MLPKQPRGYDGRDRQVLGANNGPNCARLPNPPIPYYPAAGDLPNLNDGVDLGAQGKGDNQRTATGFANRSSRISSGRLRAPPHRRQ